MVANGDYSGIATNGASTFLNFLQMLGIRSAGTNYGFAGEAGVGRFFSAAGQASVGPGIYQRHAGVIGTYGGFMTFDNSSAGSPSSNIQTPAQNQTWGVAAAELGLQEWVSNAPNVDSMSGNFYVQSVTLGDFTVQLATSGSTWVVGVSPAAGFAYSQYNTDTPLTIH